MNKEFKEMIDIDMTLYSWEKESCIRLLRTKLDIDILFKIEEFAQYIFFARWTQRSLAPLRKSFNGMDAQRARRETTKKTFGNEEILGF